VLALFANSSDVADQSAVQNSKGSYVCIAAIRTTPAKSLTECLHFVRKGSFAPFQRVGFVSSARIVHRFFETLLDSNYLI
jgi:hypothetical protein